MESKRDKRAGGVTGCTNALVISEIAMALVPPDGGRGLAAAEFFNIYWKWIPVFRVDHILTMGTWNRAFAAFHAGPSSFPSKTGSGFNRKQSLEFEQIAEHIRALSGREGSRGAIDDLPLSTEFRQASRFVIEGQAPSRMRGERGPIVQFRTVSLSYFFHDGGFPCARVRFLYRGRLEGAEAAVINETMETAFLAPGPTRLGKAHQSLLARSQAVAGSTLIGIVGKRASVWAGCPANL